MFNNQLLGKEIPDPWSVTFVDSCNINTPTTADFKLPMGDIEHKIGKRCAQSAFASRHQHNTGYVY